MKAEAAAAATGFSPGAEGGRESMRTYSVRERGREGGGQGSSGRRTLARTDSPQRNSGSVVLPPTAAASSPSSFRARAIPSFPLSPLSLSLRRCWPKTTRVQCHERGRGRCTRATPLQTDGSSSHYDAALHTSREATAAAADAVRNSCVAPVNILRWRPTVQGGERGDDGKDETILSCRAPRSDAT